jgi:hypothetical protein
MKFLPALAVVAMLSPGPLRGAPETRIIDGVTFHILRAPADTVRIV